MSDLSSVACSPLLAEQYEHLHLPELTHMLVPKVDRINLLSIYTHNEAELNKTVRLKPSYIIGQLYPNVKVFNPSVLP